MATPPKKKKVFKDKFGNVTKEEEVTPEEEAAQKAAGQEFISQREKAAAQLLKPGVSQKTAGVQASEIVNQSSTEGMIQQALAKKAIEDAIQEKIKQGEAIRIAAEEEKIKPNIEEARKKGEIIPVNEELPTTLGAKIGTAAAVPAAGLANLIGTGINAITGEQTLSTNRTAAELGSTTGGQLLGATAGIVVGGAALAASGLFSAIAATSSAAKTALSIIGISGIGGVPSISARQQVNKISTNFKDAKSYQTQIINEVNAGRMSADVALEEYAKTVAIINRSERALKSLTKSSIDEFVGGGGDDLARVTDYKENILKNVIEPKLMAAIAKPNPENIINELNLET